MNKQLWVALIIMLLLVATSLYGSCKDIMDQLYEQESTEERMEE